ncbi:tetratricopeptide repeat protein [Halomonas llamarensis]|uniref:Tetratricopeptide repeat protein n=1 Tax=Halomonas llamarensis TaxID=2945104 RepID=A0ABT0SPN0_9GAMM|nr:hypothetical protein [Halomonas llamarensis]MCL7929760.1 hypothetical protein [Halomonas llamarensis]
MAKKKRKGHLRSKTPATLHHADSETLTQEAQKALEEGRFREAISTLKLLLKQTDTVQTRQYLAQAYEGRAMALADKGMDKEALVIWHNRRMLGSDVAPVRLPYADVLLRLGNTNEAVALLNGSATEGISRAERDVLRTKLAAHSLAGNAAIRDALPDDDPLHQHLLAAETALEAYCNGDDEALTQALAGIPFRSPCRDLVHILKALQRVDEAPKDAKTRLAKVADTSAFASLRQAAELACVPENEAAAQLAGMGEATRRFVLTLRGWDRSRQSMQQALQKLGPTPSNKALFKLMYHHQTTLGKSWVDEHALRLLVEEFPDSAQWLRQQRPVQPPNYDLLRLLTWYLEDQKADPWEHHDSLERLADELLLSVPLPESDHALRIALTLRRTDALFHLLDEIPSKDPEALDRQVAAFVEESLDYDPDDPEPYLRLHGYYLRGKQLKQARVFEQQALQHWPNDVRVLTAALDTAVTSQAFKKAAKLAHQVLAIDPINRGARERLVKAHLAHAAKQLRAKRPDLADNELMQARQWDTGRFSVRCDIVAALTQMQNDSSAGIASLLEIYEQQGGGLAAHFNIALELLAAGESPTHMGKRFGIKKPQAQDTADLDAFVTRLQEQLTSEKLPEPLKRYFTQPLKTAAHLPLTFDAMVQLCELLKRCDWQEPRLAIARAALKQWSKAPTFVLHAFEAKYPRQKWQASDQEIRRLDAAEARAIEAGDMRTATRLREILAHFRFLEAPLFGGSSMAFDEDELDDEMANPFGHASESSAVLADLHEHGLEALCNDLGLDKKTQQALRAMERDFGLEVVAEFVSNMLMNIGEYEP